MTDTGWTQTYTWMLAREIDEYSPNPAARRGIHGTYTL